MITVAGDKKTILVFGDSLTAGYGIGKAAAFPALLQEKINTFQWNFKVINAGVSGDTSAGGLRRLDWVLRQPIDVFILELGANDGLRGVPTEETEANLTKIFVKVKEKNPDAILVLAGMKIPPNLGPDFTRDFETLFPKLAARFQATLVPFLLEGVAGRPHLNLPDGIHPTEAGHRIVADTVWKYLKPLIAPVSQASAEK